MTFKHVATSVSGGSPSSFRGTSPDPNSTVCENGRQTLDSQRKREGEGGGGREKEREGEGGVGAFERDGERQREGPRTSGLVSQAEADVDCPWKAKMKVISQKVFIQSFCKSQFPDQSVNLSFVVTNIKNKLTDLCGN